MSFSFNTKVRFGDCDPAGIVFYPRYFEMLNAALEDWFADGLGCDFEELHRAMRTGTPTVRLDSKFLAPSQLNDQLTVTIDLLKLSERSCDILYTVSSGDQVRMTAESTLVCMDLDRRRAKHWPSQIFERMAQDLPQAA
ncbi:MAG: acyl-CoA thioesterase [Pseudomonadota bacterium]